MTSHFTYSNPFPNSDNPKLLDPLYLKDRIREARRICVDLTRLQYWLALDLLRLSEEARWLCQMYAAVLSTDDANVLELVAQIGEDELIRRDRLFYPDGTPPTVAGYVYLLSSELGFYKIGCSSKPQNRLLIFGVQLPFAVDCLCTIYSKDMYALEKRLHREFISRRVQGEWFKLTAEDVEYIKGLAT